MVVAVNTRLLLKDRLDGMGRFAHEILKRITSAHPEVEFLFLFDRSFNDEFIYSNNVTPIVVPPPARHPVLWYWWLEQSLPKIFLKYDPDLFLSPDGFLSLSYAPPAGMNKMKSVPVIHDLNFEHHPENVPFLARKFFKRYFPRYAKKADKIITVSEFSKNDIADTYKVSPEKIEVIYNAAHKGFKPLTDEARTVVKEQYSDGKDYFFFAGSIQPRKNIERMLKAFDQFKSKHSSSVKLLISGSDMYKTDHVKTMHHKMRFKSDVIFLGRLSDNELCRVMAATLSLVFVPTYEGFGIPIVEAMQCHVPVLHSNSTALPEIAGVAGLSVDPNSTESIADGMESMVNDLVLRNGLIEKGKTQMQKFSWDQSAARLWETLEHTLK